MMLNEIVRIEFFGPGPDLESFDMESNLIHCNRVCFFFPHKGCLDEHSQ